MERNDGIYFISNFIILGGDYQNRMLRNGMTWQGTVWNEMKLNAM